LPDVFYASTDGIESCNGTIPFLPADGIKRKKSDTLDRYPSAFVVDANAKSGLFFSVEMLAPQPKSYSGYVSKLNTRKRLLEVGVDPESKNSARMAFSVSHYDFPRFSIDGKYIKISSRFSYPGTYEVRSRKEIDPNTPKIASQFDPVEKWKLIRDPKEPKRLYATSGVINYFVTDFEGDVEWVISKDGNFVAVLFYFDPVTRMSRIEIFCRDCE
jgi:hypothetical protein